MSDAEDDGVGRREVAYRLFAAEFEDADRSYSAGDDDRSPNYVITPTGARVNRLFAVGVLTEVDQVSDDVLRGRVVDPTGAFVTYAGQYQPDEQAFLERVETPTFVAMTGKARTFQPEDSEQVYTSVRPESINEVDAETRDRWTVQAAEQTLDRIGHVAAALTLDASGDALEELLLERGIDEGLAAGIPIALEHYGTTPTYLNALRELSLDAARVVAGETDEVGELQERPADRGDVSVSDLPDTGADVSTPASAPDSVEAEGESEPTTVETPSTESVESTADAESAAPDPDESTAGTSVDESDSAGATGTPDTTNAGVDDTSGSGRSQEVDDTDTVDRSDSPEDLGDFDPEEFELDEETREHVEEEYGTEFQSGTEVGEPGELDIDTPDVSTEEPGDDNETTADEDTEGIEPSTSTPEAIDESADEGVDESAETEVDERAETEVDERAETEVDERGGVGDESQEIDSATDTSADSAAESPDEESNAEPDDLQAAVVELMGELDSGEGADKHALVDEMGDRYGVDAEQTEDAIQEALMSGECYEPSDGTFKRI